MDRKASRKIEEKSHEFLRALYPLIRDYKGQLPNLRDIFRPEAIDWLLGESMKKSDDNSMKPGPLIEFVISAGYRDEPEVDKDGKPLLHRTTAVHRLAMHRASMHTYLDSEGYDMTRELFKIYDRFDVNYTDEFGLTHLHVACRCNLNNIVEKFLELGQDPNLLEQEGNSPLHFALRDIHNNETFELLLRSGVNPNLANAEGNTPLHYICMDYFDDLSIVESFFKVNNELQQTVYVDAQNKLGMTPLHYAADSSTTKVTEFLLKRGADPNVVDANGATALHIVCWRDADDGYDDHVDKTKTFLELLLKRGANPNLAEEKGFTPLHNICRRDHDDDVVEMFFKTIQQTIEVDAQDKLGRTPLQWAVASLLPGVINVLLDHGADLSSFVFPTFEHFVESIVKPYGCIKLKLASGAGAVVECLKKRMYEPNTSDILTIMKIFSKSRLFEKSADDSNCYQNDELFARETKKIEIRPGLSLYDLIQLRPNEATKLIIRLDFPEFVFSPNWKNIPKNQQQACIDNLIEKLSRGFVRRWAMDFFMELTCYQLPILCCEIIIKHLKNVDLCNVCLATTSQDQ